MAVVASGVFMATLDASIVNVSLPTLVRELDAPFDRIQWVTLAYVIAITSLLLPAGRLAQMRGAKRLYLAGFLVFTLGSLLCGLAPNAGALIGFRVIQGIGGSITQALGPALVVTAFPAPANAEKPSASSCPPYPSASSAVRLLAASSWAPWGGRSSS